MVVRRTGPLCTVSEDRKGMISDVKNGCIEELKGWSRLQPADITVCIPTA